VFFGLILLLSCCQTRVSPFAQMVPSATGAFWTLQTTAMKQKVARGYKFYLDGKCVYYLLGDATGREMMK
jgi:hypothetical protein